KNLLFAHNTPVGYFRVTAFSGIVGGKRDKLLSENCHSFTAPLYSKSEFIIPQNKPKYLISMHALPFMEICVKQRE
ncbi:MAG: hypothetical protein PWK00_01975, partial [Coxiella burnetii]|nr:hypothetical protein [Coxiella burnetii]